MSFENCFHKFKYKKQILLIVILGIVIGCLIGLVLVLLLIVIGLIIIRISKLVSFFLINIKKKNQDLCDFLRSHRTKTIKYLKSDDDHRQHLNESVCSPDSNDHQSHQPKRPLQIEHPHLLSNINHHRINDNLSDRESLLKQPTSHIQAISTTIDNFYEEIKEQQHHHQNHLDTENNQDKNTYLEPKSFTDRKKFFEDNNNKSSQPPIRDHREVFYYEYDG